MSWEGQHHDTNFSTHITTCLGHDEEDSSSCWGQLGTGEKCKKKVTGVANPVIPPMCEIHQYQYQLLNSGACEALLPCGFRCTRRCSWQVHGFKLCPLHYQWDTACYLLRLPFELRDRIYGLVFAKIAVKDKRKGGKIPEYVPKSSKTAILRVNRQLHEETTQHLFAKNTIKVQLLDEGICMSFSRNLKPSGRIVDINEPATFTGRHFQMICRTEYVNSKLRRARQKASASGQHSSSTTSQSKDGKQKEGENSRTRPGALDWHNWIFPLTALQFNMLRRIRIDIYLFAPDSVIPTTIPPEHVAIGAVMHGKLKSNLSEYCTQMQVLVERLMLIPVPLSYLEVAIRFYDTCMDRKAAVSAALLLLQPFRRLRNISAVKVLSVAPGPEDDPWAEVESPISSQFMTDKSFLDYLDCWTKELTSSEPLPAEG